MGEEMGKIMMMIHVADGWRRVARKKVKGRHDASICLAVTDGYKMGTL